MLSGILFTSDRIPSLLVVHLGLLLPGQRFSVGGTTDAATDDSDASDEGRGARSEEGVRREWSRSQKYKKGNMI